MSKKYCKYIFRALAFKVYVKWNLIEPKDNNEPSMGITLHVTGWTKKPCGTSTLDIPSGSSILTLFLLGMSRPVRGSKVT